MQGLVELIMNSLYGVQIRRHINEFFKYKSEHRMETECDDSVSDYWKLPKGNYLVKLTKDDKLDGDNDI